MILIKVWYRFTGLLLKAVYKVVYGRHMRWGKGFHMRRGFQATVENGGVITLGNNVFFNNGCGLHARKAITIGDETIFGENVHVYDHNHRFADPTLAIKDQGYTEAPVTIGRHCWIGSNVTILKGASIGDNTVIGAGCVISGTISANSVVRTESSLQITPIRQAPSDGLENQAPSDGPLAPSEGPSREANAGGVCRRGANDSEPEKGARSASLIAGQAVERSSTGGETAHQASPTRILVLDTVMDRGGAETMMMNYLRHMDRSKVTYDFLVNRDYRAAYEDEIGALGGRIYRMCPMYPQYFGRYKREFRAFLKAHPEYRVIHSNLEERSYFGLREAKKLGVPVRIAHAHNRPVGFDLKSIFREYFRLRLPKYTTHMFACGEEAGDWLFGVKNRSRVIQQRNAIDTSLYRYNPSLRSEVRTEIMASNPLAPSDNPLAPSVEGAVSRRLTGGESPTSPSSTFVLGHVGRFFPQKNHTFLIDIFAALHRMRPDSELWLVGGGELNDELKNQIRAKVDELGLHDAVRFLGVRSDVHRLMQGMDAFVLPSLFEGLPVTMVEAQAAGLPCTISDRVPGQCAITPNVQTVALDASPEEWAQRILAQAEHPKVTDRTQGPELVTKAGFDITANAEWLQRFYLDELAKAEGKAPSGRPEVR